MRDALGMMDALQDTLSEVETTLRAMSENGDFAEHGAFLRDEAFRALRCMHKTSQSFRRLCALLKASAR